MELALRHNINQNYSTHSFRSYYGNDETVFEAPGTRIPSITLTRDILFWNITRHMTLRLL